MCNPAALTAVQVVGAVAQAQAAKRAAQAQQTALNQNAQAAEFDAGVQDNNALIASGNANIADQQAQDALYRGGRQRQETQLQGAAAKGAARAALAANGMDLTEGTPVDVLTSGDYALAKDLNTIEDNALRSAWGYQTQAVNDRNQAQAYSDSAKNTRYGAGNLRRNASAINPNSAAAVSLLGSATQVAGNWYAMKRAGG